MGGVKTVEQAMALPEVESAMWDEVVTIRADGVTVKEYKPRKFCAAPVSGDNIILFVDSDGVSKQVIETENGPAKVPFYF